MKAFEYAVPKTREQAVALLGKQWGESEVLAGGTDLLGLMKDDIVAPKRLINIKQVAEPIPEMHAIRMGTSIVPGMSGTQRPKVQGISIGALTVLARIPEATDVQKHLPMLASAAAEAASPQIRNLATIGGNMCQRPRCWYFRTGNGLLAQTKDGKSLVLEGDNRYHAILGNDGPAYFVSPSTVAPVLIAYNAVIRITGSAGKREMPLEKFFRIPKTEGEREHDLRPDELVTSIFVPLPAAGMRAAAYEVRQKEAFDWPYATAAVALTLQGNTVQSARVVLGHVAPIPWLSPEAAQALQGKAINTQTADAAAQAAIAGAKSLGKNAYKINLARVAVRRAILKAGGAA
jgi:xanthine dehydrogenase YagS FAD-binding subunit